MSTAEEIKMRMLAAQPLLDRHYKRMYEVFNQGIVNLYMDRMLTEMRGVKSTKHARRRGARGRKRALMAARWWRPVKIKIRLPYA